jgi:hypothetical protein
MDTAYEKEKDHTHATCSPQDSEIVIALGRSPDSQVKLRLFSSAPPAFPDAAPSGQWKVFS